MSFRIFSCPSLVHRRLWQCERNTGVSFWIFESWETEEKFPWSGKELAKRGCTILCLTRRFMTNIGDLGSARRGHVEYMSSYNGKHGIILLFSSHSGRSSLIFPSIFCCPLCGGGHVLNMENITRLHVHCLRDCGVSLFLDLKVLLLFKLNCLESSNSSTAFTIVSYCFFSPSFFLLNQLFSFSWTL